MSTIHCRTARDAFNRIATYAIQSSERLPHEASFQLIAGGLDYVIFVSRHPGTGQRRLDTILEVNGYDEVVQASELFGLGASGEAVWTGVNPSRVHRLVAAGWTPPDRFER
jgi:pilus assembly protein CpaF